MTTPLMYAASNGSDNVVKALLERDAKPDREDQVVTHIIKSLRK